jgi:hypothetical protein
MLDQFPLEIQVGLYLKNKMVPERFGWGLKTLFLNGGLLMNTLILNIQEFQNLLFFVHKYLDQKIGTIYHFIST